MKMKMKAAVLCSALAIAASALLVAGAQSQPGASGLPGAAYAASAVSSSASTSAPASTSASATTSASTSASSAAVASSASASTSILPGELPAYAAGSGEEYPGANYLSDLNDYWGQIATDYAPVVTTLADGRKIQRTPTEYDVGAWMKFSDTISYNTYYLDADHRGCNACHEDLSALIKGMDYKHPAFWNEALGTNITIQQCIFCHGATEGYIQNDYQLGSVIHALHYGTRLGSQFDALGGTCYSCHNATGDGQGMEMWDLVKYNIMNGIVDVPDVQGDLKIDQDKVVGMSDVYSVDWMHTFYDNLRYAAGENGENLTPSQTMFDEWTITVDGTVNSPYTEKLSVLISEAEAAGVVVTKASKMHCDWDPIGCGLISNVEITGIPVSWLIERAGGYKDGTTGVHVVRADDSSHRAFSLAQLGQSYLVYKMGGEYLDYSRGYPCTNWTEAVDAQVCSKQINEYQVTDEDLDYAAQTPCGWQSEAVSIMNAKEGDTTMNADSYLNKPNVAICNLPDGLIIKTGEPYTFEGVADAYDERVATLEFSMDRGKTWTSYELTDDQNDPTKWVYWYFTWTPPQEGAYCISVRATTDTGRTMTEYQTIMFNAHDVI